MSGCGGACTKCKCEPAVSRYRFPLHPDGQPRRRMALRTGVDYTPAPAEDVALYRGCVFAGGTWLDISHVLHRAHEHELYNCRPDHAWASEGYNKYRYTTFTRPEVTTDWDAERNWAELQALESEDVLG